MSSGLPKNKNITEGYFGKGFFKNISAPAVWVFIICLILAFYVGKNVAPTWSLEKVALDVNINQEGQLFYKYKGKEKLIENVVDYSQAQLTSARIETLNVAGQAPEVTEEFIVKTDSQTGKKLYYQHKAQRHWKFWSFLPAIVAILLCFLTREPITALVGGIVTGAFLVGAFDLTDAVLIPRLATKSAAGVLILYLWLLGGLMGVWSRTGAAQAFATYMADNFVKGPRSAKLVAWFLGILFFQGGTVSTVLVGTTVKPLADEEKISHEELSYIVDSTASPIASILAFNAWPGYVQAFIYVAGVSFLATEADRLSFFFSSVPLSFYSLIAITFTFLLSIDKLPKWIMGRQMVAAFERSRNEGLLDAPDAEPLSSADMLSSHNVPEGYTPHVSEFFIPIVVLIAIAIGTFVATGSPQVRWAFGAALLVAMGMALMRGMRLRNLMLGFEDGLKGVVVGSVILLLAITIGGISKEAGGGIYLVELLGNSIPYFLLPVILQLMTMFIAFSTGTSWGTYAVAFPLAMPLAWAVSTAQGIENPYIFLLVCFATVMNGSVYGDQCSPISDTTVLSSLVTGCDLMDHVKTQIIPASIAAGIAAILWTLTVLIFA